MSVLEITNLCKNYPSFKLDNVSFSLEKGKITGFIGRNGAGKSTTLKSIFNFVHPDSGSVKFFDMIYTEHEFDIKQRVGFVSGGVDYYPLKKIKTITNVTRNFYSRWDDASYKKYMSMFNLDENKTPSQLSAGMKVKYALVLALSHNAELLILDEPTSGLDPVSRDDLLDVFMGLSDEGKTILFSTHITSDLDKCADNIVYIKNGRIIAEDNIQSFINNYRVIELSNKEACDEMMKKFIGLKRIKNGYSALVRTTDYEDTLKGLGDNVVETHNPDLEEIMVHIEKED